jgi:hypothetical protein
MTYVCTFISIVLVLLGSLVLDDKLSPDHLSWLQGGLIGVGALTGAVFDWRALRRRKQPDISDTPDSPP